VPRYFMHLVHSVDILLDPDGLMLEPEVMPEVALRQARDCMAGDVQDGRLDLHYRIDVHDEGGDLVHSLPFADALEIVGAS